MPLVATIGAVTALTSMGMSIGQAAKASRLEKRAQKEAAKYMEEARKKLDVNYFESLSLPMEAYELEREATLSTMAQAMEAGRESERGAAATAGRILQASNLQQQKSRVGLASDKLRLDAIIANEESRLRDELAKLELGEVEGAQKAIKDNWELKNKAIMNAVTSLGSAAGFAEQNIDVMRSGDYDTLFGVLLGLEGKNKNTATDKLPPRPAGADEEEFAKSIGR